MMRPVFDLIFSILSFHTTIRPVFDKMNRRMKRLWNDSSSFLTRHSSHEAEKRFISNSNPLTTTPVQIVRKKELSKKL
mgnify:CR=1 FL=1